MGTVQGEVHGEREAGEGSPWSVQSPLCNRAWLDAIQLCPSWPAPWPTAGLQANDVHHADRNPANNALDNLAVLPRWITG